MWCPRLAWRFVYSLNDVAWRQKRRERFWTAAGRSRSDAGQGRPAHNFVRNEVGLPQAGREAMQAKEGLHNATSAALWLSCGSSTPRQNRNKARGVQPAPSQTVGLSSAGFTVLSCSPPPWGSPLRGQLKLSKFAPGEFVAWYRHSKIPR